MKKILIGIGFAVALLVTAGSALADSFNTTNIVNNADSVISWPTNSTGVKTGGIIGLQNQEWAGFYASGYCAANSTLSLTLVRSDAASPALYRYDATGTNVNGLNFESSSQITLGFTVTAGAFCWQTNLDRALLGGANWVGIYSITNITASGSLTNLDMGLNKKIIPIRYP